MFRAIQFIVQPTVPNEKKTHTASTYGAFSKTKVKRGRQKKKLKLAAVENEECRFDLGKIEETTQKKTTINNDRMTAR